MTDFDAGDPPPELEEWPLAPELVTDLAARWRADPGSLSFLAAAKNAIFVFTAGGERRVLRIHHTGDRNRSAIVAELHWVRALARRGIRVARPFQSRNRRWVEQATVGGGGSVRAAAFEFVSGRHPSFVKDGKPRLELIRRAGVMLGRIHGSNDGYRRPHLARRHDLPRLELPRAVEVMAPYAEDEFKSALREHWKTLRALPRKDGYGLVHGDYHGANLLAEDEVLTALDFDNCYYSWYLSDIAHFLSMGTIALREKDAERCNRVGRAMFLALMTGYATEKRLDAEWFSHLPFFLRGFDLLYYFNLLTSFGGDAGRLSEAPYYEVMRASALEDRPGLELDFVELYESIEVPKKVPKAESWLVGMVRALRGRSTTGS